MRDIAHGVGPLPAGEGVGGEAGVHEAEVGHQLGVGEIGVVEPQLARVKLALVDDGGGGEGADVEAVLGEGVRGSLKNVMENLSTQWPYSMVRYPVPVLCVMFTTRYFSGMF